MALFVELLFVLAAEFSGAAALHVYVRVRVFHRSLRTVCTEECQPRACSLVEVLTVTDPLER